MVQVVFTNPVDAGTVNASTFYVTGPNGAPVNGTTTLSGQTASFTLPPYTQWALGTTYTVHIIGVQGADGSLAPAATSAFTTSNKLSLPTAGAFSLTSATPANGASVNDNLTPIVLTFNEPVDPASVANLAVGTGNNYIAGQWAVSGATVTFTPQTPYPANSNIFVTAYPSQFPYAVSDLAGNPAYGYFTSFNVANSTDSTPFQVISSSPSNGATNVGPYGSIVVLRLSKSADTSSLANGLAVYAGDQIVSTQINHSVDGRTLTLGATFAPNQNVTVATTSGLKDLSGNSIQPFTLTFGTANQSSTAPQIVSMLPSRSYDIPLNATITLFTSQPPDASTVQGAVHVIQDGIEVAGTAQLTSPNSIRWIPAQPFLANATIQVYVDASLTFSGFEMQQAFTGTFSTVSTTGTSPPILLATNFGGTVPADATLKLEFDQPIEPTSANANNISLYGCGQLVPSAFAVNGPNQNIVEILPNSPLRATCPYLMTEAGLLNSAAQPSTWASWQFSVTPPSNTNPKLISVSPSAAQIAGVNATVVLRFSKAIDPLTVNPSSVGISAAGAPVPVSFSFGASDGTVYAQPQQPLPPNASVAVQVSGIEDIEGHQCLPASSQFRTGPQADVTPAAVTNVSPANGSPIPLNTKFFSLRFSKPIDPITVNAQTVQVTEQYATVAGSYSVTSDLQTIVFKPAANSIAAGYLTINVQNVLDLNGNVVSSGSYNFTVQSETDSTPLTVTGTFPQPGAASVPLTTPIQIQFSAPVDVATLDGITLRQGGTAVQVQQILSSGDELVTLAPAAPLDGSATYSVEVRAVRDIAGNPLAAAKQITFSTASALVPVTAVATLLTPSTSSGVPDNTVIQVRFSTPMDPISLGPAMWLTQNSFTFIPLTFSLSADRMTATWTPATPLTSGNQYVLELGPALSASGNYSNELDLYFTVQ